MSSDISHLGFQHQNISEQDILTRLTLCQDQLEKQKIWKFIVYDVS